MALPQDDPKYRLLTEETAFKVIPDAPRMLALEKKNIEQDTAIANLRSRGYLPNDTNLNGMKALTDVGAYTIFGDNTTVGLPAGVSGRLSVDVVRGGQFSVYQRVTTVDGFTFLRSVKTGNPDNGTHTWSAWQQVITKADLAAYALLTRGYLPNNTNLNTMVSSSTVGAYTIFGDATTTGLPGGAAGRLTLEVVVGGQFSVVQYLTSTTGGTYTRAVQSGDPTQGTQVWSDWVQSATKADVAGFAQISRGYLINNADLNTMVSNGAVGVYTLFVDTTTVGRPTGVTGRVTFEVIRGGQFSVVQRLITAANATWSRSVQSGDANAGTQVWSPWIQMATKTDITGLASLTRGYLPNNTNLNTMATAAQVGTYTLFGDTTTGGLPESVTGRLTVTIEHGGQFSVVQRLTTAAGIGYTRAVQTGDANAGTQVWSAWVATTLDLKSSRTKICMIGDSLIDSHKLPESVAAGLPKVTVYNRGWNGNTTDSIAIRMGAYDTYWTVTGGTIPAAAGGSVEVKTRQTLAFRNGLNSYGGWLAGVYGSLYSDNGVDFRFIREAAGTAVTVTGTQKFISWIAPAHRSDTLGLLLGRNDVSIKAKGQEASVVEHVISNTAKFVNEFMTPQIKQFFILGTVNATSEVAGSVENKMVRDMNDRIAQLWPGHFIDLRTYLVTKAIYDLAITPTAADLDAISKDAPPPSVMMDDVHFSDAAAKAIADNLIIPWLLGKGYVDA